MKVVILAGGLGTRISEESHLVPKPMIKIGGKPILWHIMQYFASYGHNEFIILAGYKQEVIKDYFNNYYLHNSDTTFYLRNQSNELVKSYSDNWVVTVIDSGLHTSTAGRLLYAKNHLINDNAFFLTYGDGLCDVDLEKLLLSHNSFASKVTITAIKPKGRFGLLEIDNSCMISSFREKSDNDSNWVNGGFMVIDSSVLNMIVNDYDVLETDILPKCVMSKCLYAYKHYGFWQSMDTLRDKEFLDDLITKKITPWIR